MKKGDIVTIDDINKWKNKTYRQAFNSARYSEKDGRAWWRRTKKNIKDTKFKVIQIFY